VRHPLRTVESAVAGFCAGRDDKAAADASVMLDTLALLFPPPAGALSAATEAAAERAQQTSVRRPQD